MQARLVQVPVAGGVLCRCVCGDTGGPAWWSYLAFLQTDNRGSTRQQEGVFLRTLRHGQRVGNDPGMVGEWRGCRFLGGRYCLDK